ncbi:hypothetical protein [Plantactinospora sp. B5E13]|uniref:pilus assembly protein TadG-related protein n=1 Tax=unclassified Plantactinospora TaxID=2631981 RepID=UPI00325E4FA2
MSRPEWDVPPGDAGRVSLFLAIALVGILTLIGLAYDGAGQLRTMQRADNLAAEAARAGGQAVDLGQLLADGTTVLDRDAARAAIDNYLDSVDGVTLRNVDIQVEDGNPRLTVDLELTYERAFLGLFSFDGTVTVPGTATATLLTTSNR